MRELLISAEKIIDCLNDGVYVCDRNRRIVFWSKAAERITGWRSEDVLGRACLEDILNHVDKDGHRLCGEEYCPLHRAMITGVTTKVPVIVFALCKDGRRVPTQVTTAPIHNEAGEIIGGVETFRDVSPILVDLERAQKIQRQTLQHELPEDPRLQFSAFFMPYDIVGGDYYAIQPLDADRYGFLLADMEGHGVAAAHVDKGLGPAPDVGPGGLHAAGVAGVEEHQRPAVGDLVVDVLEGIAGIVDIDFFAALAHLWVLALNAEQARLEDVAFDGDVLVVKAYPWQAAEGCTGKALLADQADIDRCANGAAEVLLHQSADRVEIVETGLVERIEVELEGF